MLPATGDSSTANDTYYTEWLNELDNTNLKVEYDRNNTRLIHIHERRIKASTAMPQQTQQNGRDSMSGLEIELVHATRYKEAMVDKLEQRGIYTEIMASFRKYRVEVIENEDKEEKLRGKRGEIEAHHMQEILKTLHQQLHSKTSIISIQQEQMLQESDCKFPNIHPLSTHYLLPIKPPNKYILTQPPQPNKHTCKPSKPSKTNS